jgi:SIT family siderophore-iron:H+ symporter-like MFS transporter
MKDWWTTFPNIPGAINAFVAANVVDSLMAHGDVKTQWRWGFGIFVILTPVLSLPIILTLWYNTRPTSSQREDARIVKASQPQRPFAYRLWTGSKSFFWQLDVIGLFMFVIGFGLFFVTITLANSQTSRWSDGHSIAQLVLGGIFVIAFIIWERYYSPHPLLPFALLRRKTVIGCVLIALFHPMAGRIAGGYLFTFLQVAANQSVLSTTRITSFPTIAGTVSGIIGALVARKYCFLKPIIILPSFKF